jgi:hypothetical protein
VQQDRQITNRSITSRKPSRRTISRKLSRNIINRSLSTTSHSNGQRRTATQGRRTKGINGIGFNKKKTPCQVYLAGRFLLMCGLAFKTSMNNLAYGDLFIN